MAEEVVPTLPPPPGVDLARLLRGSSLARFRNPALPHRTQQIAMDGSQKLPQRLLATVRERLAGGGSIAHLALAVAGWIRYASGTDEHGKPIDVSDPLAAKFAAIAAPRTAMPRTIADGFLDLAACSAPTCRPMPRFGEAVSRDVGALFRDGVRRTLARAPGAALLRR